MWATGSTTIVRKGCREIEREGYKRDIERERDRETKKERAISHVHMACKQSQPAKRHSALKRDRLGRGGF